MAANMTGPPVLPVLPVTRVVHGVSVAGRYGPVIQIGDPSLIPLSLHVPVGAYSTCTERRSQ